VLALKFTSNKRFGYTGQMRLPEIGSFYHYKARAYAPAWGRFLQSDPIGSAGGMNLYAYTDNDPVNGSDPSGLAPIDVYGPTYGTRPGGGYLGDIVVCAGGCNNPFRNYRSDGFSGGQISNLFGPRGLSSLPSLGSLSLGSFAQQEATGNWRGTAQDFTSTGPNGNVLEDPTTWDMLLMGLMPLTAPELVAARTGTLAIRPGTAAIAGGRGGALIKSATGPANSALRGMQNGRVLVTDRFGRVILDITKSRVKPVTPRVGFGPKRPPTPQEIRLIDRVWGY
jgi:RHS repeat-associated protein